jgi:hypothetical protein
VVCDERSDGLCSNQRHIAAQDNHLAAGFGYQRQRALYSMASTERFVLEGKQGRGMRADDLPDTIGLVTDNDNDVFAGNCRGHIHDIQHHRPLQHLVEHLCPGRFHPLAQTGGKDDCGNIILFGGVCHFEFSQLKLLWIGIPAFDSRIEKGQTTQWFALSPFLRFPPGSP